jgi:hypothetical protein
LINKNNLVKKDILSFGRGWGEAARQSQNFQVVNQLRREEGCQKTNHLQKKFFFFVYFTLAPVYLCIEEKF